MYKYDLTFYNGWYSCMTKKILMAIAAIIPITEKVLTLFPLNQPTRINSIANGGNMLIRDNTALFSCLLSLFIIANALVIGKIQKKSCNFLQDFFYFNQRDEDYFLAYLKFLPIKRAAAPSSSSIRNN